MTPSQKPIHGGKDDLLQRFHRELLVQHQKHLPSRLLIDHSESFIKRLLQLLFPQWRTVPLKTLTELKSEMRALQDNLEVLISSLNCPGSGSCRHQVRHFFRELPSILPALQADAEAIFAGDPAAESIDEVILAYPGFFAIAVHRCAHALFRLKVPLLPRLLSEHAHRATGIDIHPGACIGRHFCIDHGTGVVIGATTIIGANVKIYQGVTLGALSVEKKLAGSKRHPTIEDNVIIYAQAVILGGETLVGHDSIIGGNVWLTHSVPPYSRLTYNNETNIHQRSLRSNHACGKPKQNKEKP
jgi:serine O-acetyltransferase